MMRKLLFIAILAISPAHAENVLSNTDHIVTAVTQAITILGGTVGAGGTYVDQTCKTNYSTNTVPAPSQPVGYLGVDPAGCLYWNGSAVTSTTFWPFATLIAASTNPGAALYANNSAALENAAPYSVLNQSSTGYTLQSLDQQNYATLAANNQVYVMAFCGSPLAGDYPPVMASTILPSLSTIANTPDGGSGCGYGSGIEFSMTPGYKGFATGTPSGTTEAMSGVYSVLKTNHPTWTYRDIKAALRQTADSWGAGYATYHASPLGFGYGNINYDAANALSGTSAIYLQAPGMAVNNYGQYAQITLYPFVTTRRAKEVVYVGGTWPAASTLNEMEAAQIVAAGGTKIYDDGGASGIQTFDYAPAASGSATFTVLTLDSSGNGSRVESFSRIAETFTNVGSQCHQ